MKMLLTIFLSLVAYATTAKLLFGSSLQPIALITLWNDRLGAPFWPILL
ncbi:hypothetical protein SAMN06265380_10555 [Ruegeria faecimaris]|uniref:Uncharacterized protein n=1 Tax=Ruegeria faecimaris TaxID=686389 RepID=A0A521D7Z1_9RHOB|nr:hypothetical protein SAMN06265380_10555 [Ruegeria faecimaris]